MSTRRIAIWLGISSLSLALLACSFSPRLPRLTVGGTPTSTIRPTRSQDILPPKNPAAAATPTRSGAAATQPAATPARLASATPVQTLAPTAAVQGNPTARPNPTADPKRVVVTEDDIARTLSSGIGEEQGLKVRNATVRFADGKMTIAADELGVGPLQVRNLVMVGVLFAQDGQLAFEAESISPRGLMTNMLPGIANQMLSQYASRWYVEDVRIEGGRLELRIR